MAEQFIEIKADDGSRFIPLANLIWIDFTRPGKVILSVQGIDGQKTYSMEESARDFLYQKLQENALMLEVAPGGVTKGEPFKVPPEPKSRGGVSYLDDQGEAIYARSRSNVLLTGSISSESVPSSFSFRLIALFSNAKTGKQLRRCTHASHVSSQ